MKRVKCTAKSGGFLFYAFGNVIFSGALLYLFGTAFFNFFSDFNNTTNNPILYFFAVLLIVISLSPLFAVKPYLRAYSRVKGKFRFIEISESYISFPKTLSSLELENINLNSITNIYFSQDRHGNDDNLIIKYNENGHAYIDFNLVGEFELRQIYNQLRNKVLL